MAGASSFFSRLVSAQIIFDGGSGTVFPGLFADTGDPGFEGNPYTAAGDVFISNLTTAANSIEFFGVYNSGEPGFDSFQVNLYSVIAGAPATLLATLTLSNLTISAVSEYDYNYQANLSAPFALAAGTLYFIDISDTTTPFQGFNLGFTSSGAQAYSFNSSAGTFEKDGSATALIDVLSSTFALEPPMWAMMFAGFLGLIGWRRMRCKSRLS